MPRKTKPSTPIATAEEQTPVVRQVTRYTRKDALAWKPTYAISCLQEAGADWRMVFTKPDNPGWIVGTMNTLGLNLEAQVYQHELEANQRFHQLLKEWAG